MFWLATFKGGDSKGCDFRLGAVVRGYGSRDCHATFSSTLQPSNPATSAVVPTANGENPNVEALHTPFQGLLHCN